ncbi:MAG: hypothetical protein WAK31_30680 [Chthoniobacterales bacterium]
MDYPLFNRDYVLYNGAQGGFDPAMVLMIASKVLEKLQLTGVSNQSVIATEEVAATGRWRVRKC